MSTTFIHTADWQLGKPYANVADVAKRSRLQQERLDAIARIGRVAREHDARFIVVAGDLFDSNTATKATVSAACDAIRAIGLPVYVIPGNHDHGGPGSVWTQAFFLRERDALAPNLHVLLTPEPFERDDAVLLPCPLLRRHDARDPTEWLRSLAEEDGRFGGRPRIVLAHGAVQDFRSTGDDDEAGDAVNQIDLDRLPSVALDYVALGDWHGMKQVGAKAWYAGTPEFDRFAKGEDNRPGHVLAVTVARGESPRVEPVKTHAIPWRVFSSSFSDDAGVEELERMLVDALGDRAVSSVVRLDLDGSLGIEATTRLERLLETWSARLLHLRLERRTVVAPNADEIETLTQRTSDPLIAGVAARLVQMVAADDATSPAARLALRTLHAACTGA